MKSNPIQCELGTLSIYWLAAKLLQWEQLKIGKLSNVIFMQPSQYVIFNAMCSKHCTSLQFWWILGLERKKNLKKQKTSESRNWSLRTPDTVLLTAWLSLNFEVHKSWVAPYFIVCLSSINNTQPNLHFSKSKKALHWACTTKQVPSSINLGKGFQKKWKIHDFCH